MRIKVEQRHIDEGIPCKSSGCPVALAISDLLTDELEVTVGNEKVEIFAFSHTNSDLSLPLSQRTNDWIEAFDRNQTVKPFQFNLNVPKEFLR